MVKNALKYFLLFFAFNNLQAQSNKICLHFPSKPIHTYCNISINNRLVHLFPAKDTCLDIKLKKHKLSTIQINTSGYESHIIQLSDTLSQNNPIHIFLKEKYILLQEVIVRPENQITMRGDTIIIRTDSINTKPQSDASELIDKLPGGMITANGQIYLMGKSISFITVEGMSIFGGNPKTILSLLKADMIASLEIIPSENSKKETEVNIKLKEDKKKGIYGEIGGNLGSFQRKEGNFKINKIDRNLFLNTFAILNNTNQKNTTLSNLSESNVSLFKRMDGSYSLTGFMDGFVNEKSRYKYTPNLIKDEGINDSKTAGINYSRKLSNKEWIIFSLMDINNQWFDNKTDRESVFLNAKLIQNSFAQHMQESIKWWNSVGINLKVDPKNSIKILQNFYFDNTKTNIKSNTSSEYVNTPFLNFTSLNQSKSNANNFSSNQQIQWVHRYDRPSKITSLYIGSIFSNSQDDKTYLNRINIDSSTLISNHQNKYLPIQIFSIDFQLQHSIPLTRTWLIDTKLSNYFENNSLQQQTNNFNAASNSFDIKVNRASLDKFVIRSVQSNVQATLLYKNTHWSVGSGASISYIDFEKISTKNIQDNLLLLLPRFYVEYRSKSSDRFSFLYNKKYSLPNHSQLFPIPDSSRINFIQVGSPLLSFIEKNTSTLSFNISIKTGQVLIGSLQYEHIPNNFINVQKFSAVGTYNTTEQLLLPSKSINGSLIYGIFNTTKPFSFYITNFFGMLQDFMSVNNVTLKYKTYYSFSTLSLKWNVAKKTTTKLDWTGNFLSNQLENSFDNQTTIWNFRNQITLKIETQLANHLFANINTVIFDNRFEKQVKTFVVADANVSYFLRNNKIQCNASIKNIFDVNPTFTSSFSANEQFIQTQNYLPRFVTMGFIFYLSKWGK